MAKLIKIDEQSGIPLVGSIAFGIIDRGTNLLQIRATSVCNLNCLFCSTGAGPKSKFHKVNYEVELGYLLKWINEIVNFKGSNIEINIDSCGEPTTYPKLIELVKGIKQIKNVKRISMQTNGTLLDSKKIKLLENYGLNQINLSLDSLDKEKSKYLRGTKDYNVNKVIKLARIISKSKIDLLIAPVYLPGFNDEDIEDIIKFCKELKCKIGIQKYEIYKYGRKFKKIKKINWWKFYRKLEEWEKKYNIKLKVDTSSIKKAISLPLVFKKGDKVYLEVKAEGWVNGQMLGAGKNRSVMINNCNKKIGNEVKVKILENKNNIYLAE